MIESSLLSQMIESRNTGHVAFTNFVSDYDKMKNEIISYCFFEGDDDKRYYNPRIKIKYKFDNLNYVCKGKDNLLKAYNLIESKNEYNDAIKLYFVDKDFSEDLTLNNLYVTPYYSIENFYSNENVLKNILIEEFNMKSDSKDYELVLEYYSNLLNEFHTNIIFLNAWLYNQYQVRIRDGLSTRLNINEKLKSYFNPEKNIIRDTFELNIDNIENLNSKEKLEEIFNEAPLISIIEIEDTIERFNEMDKTNVFRGKFELKFFIDFLKKIKEEMQKKNSTIFDCKYKCSLDFKLINSISVLTQYAITPNCLDDFLDKHLNIA